jgi:vacuolar-type H+-ATPase subunit I/STV1
MNNIEETTFTISTVIQIVAYTGGGIGIYYTLKNKVSLLKTCIDQMEKRLEDDVKIIHDRIDKTNIKVEEKTSEITKEMKELREEIHKGQLKQEENKNEILSAIASNR